MDHELLFSIFGFGAACSILVRRHNVSNSCVKYFEFGPAVQDELKDFFYSPCIQLLYSALLTSFLFYMPLLAFFGKWNHLTNCGYTEYLCETILKLGHAGQELKGFF